MSRFAQEWALVPTAARVIAVVAALFIVMLMGLLFLAPPLAEKELPHPILWGFFALTSLVPSALLAVNILLVGYVWADAGRREMNQPGWTLLALFIPGAIGIILYFILRDPLPVPCPSCTLPVPKNQPCCTSCGATVRRSCPECRRPVEPHWSHCGHCGAALKAATRPQAP
jgi:hypothetical protein